VSNETSEDAAVRRSKEIADAELSRKMTYVLFCFALLIISIIFVACVYTFATGMPDDKKMGGWHCQHYSIRFGWFFGGAREKVMWGVQTALSFAHHLPIERWAEKRCPPYLLDPNSQNYH